jgi:hypothetical protein
MTITITSDDILTRLNKEELDALTATAIEAGQADPVQKAIDGALGEIKVAIDPDDLEAVSAEMLYRVWLSLTIPLLYPRQGAVPDKHLKEQQWAREFLDRCAKNEVPGLQDEGSWGSETRFKPRDRW